MSIAKLTGAHKERVAHLWKPQSLAKFFRLTLSQVQNPPFKVEAKDKYRFIFESGGCHPFDEGNAAKGGRTFDLTRDCFPNLGDENSKLPAGDKGTHRRQRS